MSTSSLASCASDGTGSLSTGVSSYSSTKEIYFDKCPRCRVQFDFLKRTNISSKVPLILNCKHTVCEDCIRKMCFTNSSSCPVCKETFAVTRAQIETLTELFTPHYSLIGYLLWTKNSPTKGQMNWVSTGLTLKAKQSGMEAMEVNPEIEYKSEDESVDNDTDRPTLHLDFEKCPEHSQLVNVQCEDCNEIVCCFCFLEVHGGHKHTYLYKLSDPEMVELTQSKSDVEIILRQLLFSQKKTKELKTFDLTNVENDMKNCFSELHAKLHLIEQSFKKKLLTLKVEQVDLEVINNSLRSGIQRVMQVLTILEHLDAKQLNLRALYEEIKELKKIPCLLVSDKESLNPIEFVSKVDLEGIEQQFDLKKTSDVEYNLLPIEDFSCFQNEELPFYLPSPREGSLNSKDVHENKVKPSTSTTQPTRSKETTHTKREGGGRFKIFVTHINSLNSFYVQKTAAQTSLRNMNHYIGNRPKKRMCADDVKIGRLYGVYYETKNASNWRRGKVVEIKMRGPNEFVYSIFFIDYGNTQYVSVDKLKDLDYHIIKKPPYGFECKLTNPDNITFDANAHLHLPQIIGEKELYLQYINKLPHGVQEVDLLLLSSNGDVVSVRDILLKLINQSSEPEKELLPMSKQLKLFENSKKFSSGQEIKVLVTYVKDPFHICVQLAQNIDIIEKLKNKMKHFYEGRHSTCVPVENSNVIVKYEHNYQGSWHRARITSVKVNTHQADVYFVDWGGSATVSWSDIRMLTEEFTKIECQGIVVKLSDIQKENVHEPWSKSVIDFLIQETLVDSAFRMMVTTTDPLEVALFHVEANGNICLNSLLVQRNLAVSTGNISQTLYWPVQREEAAETDSDDFSYKLIKDTEAVLLEQEDSELKIGVRQQVSVLRFESPDLIYVKLTKHKEIEEEMHKELQIHYNSCRTPKESWKPKELCVIYDSVRNHYVRGVIKSAGKSDSYVVNLYDQVREITLPKSSIFIQEPYFSRYFCYVLKCRLSNIKPAGDLTKWSKLALEMLQHIFSLYKIIHIKKVEVNREDKMIGVVMWYSLTTPAKALEPAKLNFISINRSLVESGVAFSVPKPRNDTKESDSSKNVNKNSDKSDAVKNDTKKQSKDWNDLICEDEDEASEADEVLKNSKTSWPKPMPLQNTEFEAVLTCVDSDGFFSVRDEEVHSLYLEMEENLNAKFQSLQLTQEEDIEWKLHEMCTIFYDDHWYRGTVTEILEVGEINVEMIDFGSEHVLKKNEIYKQIMYPELPPLVNKVKLYDVYSKFGQWSGTDVDELLQIVSDNVRIVIKGSLKDEVPYAEIYLPNGLSVNDLIVQKCSHMYRLETKAVLGVLDDYEEQTDEEIKEISNDEKMEKQLNGEEFNECINNYKYAPLPDISKAKMFVVNVLKWGATFNVVLNITDNKEVELSGELEMLNNEIQEYVDEQPTMYDFEINEPCICYHAQRKKWCRAIVYNVDSLEFGYVLAFFVDFGTSDMVTIQNVRVIRTEWLHLPVFNRIATVNVELIHTNKAEHVLMQMNNLRGKSVMVEIVSREPFTVHLYDGANLSYQNLINCGILRAL